MCGCGDIYHDRFVILNDDRRTSLRTPEDVALDDLRADTMRMVLAAMIRQLRAVSGAVARGWARLSRSIDFPG